MDGVILGLTLDQNKGRLYKNGRKKIHKIEERRIRDN